MLYVGYVRCVDIKHDKRKNQSKDYAIWIRDQIQLFEKIMSLKNRI